MMAKCPKCGKQYAIGVPLHERFDLRKMHKICLCDRDDPIVKAILELEERCGRENGDGSV